jgi:sulfofructose kinase
LASFGARLSVVTLGEWGALAAGADGQLDSPAYRVKARDTTGAGDAFHAGFIWGLIQRLDVEAVLRAAHAVAAINCEALGAQGGLPRRSELERFLESQAPARWSEPEEEESGR